MVGERSSSSPRVIVGNILLVFAAIVLPGIEWTLFGWLHLFLPLLVFFLLCKYGMHVGNRYILCGCIPAMATALATQTVEASLFSLSLIPSAYVLAQAGMRGNSPALSGFKGGTTMMVCWLLLIGGAGVVTGTSPFQEFKLSLGSWIDEALVHYRQSEAFEAEALIALEATMDQMKTVIPVILPGALLSGALFSTLFTMALGNRLARRYCNMQVWPRFRSWQLPDRLIWLVIGSALLAFAPSTPLRHVAANLILLLITIYCFQGFSICVFYMNKWNVPLLFRSFLYVMIIFQTFGTLALLVLGVFDTWFDFRKLSPPDTEQPSQ